ncbi:hypothetical protein L6Q96_21235 [Candidatus Binatia bacterium]|nr:hypothetical protein [Candidatus Binatia bacterium]
MARRQEEILRQIRDEAKHQLRGFPRELKHQLRGFGSEANYQLNRGWDEEFARQIFGTSKRRRG